MTNPEQRLRAELREHLLEEIGVWATTLLRITEVEPPALRSAFEAEVHHAADALRAALSAPPEEPPTYNDEPPWPGWFSCPECFGWFNDEGTAYEDGAVLCEACADERDAEAAARQPSPPPAPESTIDADAIIARGRSPTAPSSGGNT